VRLAALVVAAVAGVLFILASSVPWLGAARVVSGVAVGLAATPPAGAAIAELEPRGDLHRASMVTAPVTVGGLGMGPASDPPEIVIENRLPNLRFRAVLISPSMPTPTQSTAAPADRAPPRWSVRMLSATVLPFLTMGQAR
jgi:MFS family permease